MQGWNRDMYYDETGNEFIPTSPNIPDIDTAILYSGLCLIEGTNLSEGRGTNIPFKQIGAPWLNVDKLLGYLNSKNFEGVTFEKNTFTPISIPGKAINPKYQDLSCNGIVFNISNRDRIRPIEITLYLIKEIHDMYPDKFKFNSNNFIDNLYGSDKLRLGILNNQNIDVLINQWRQIERTNQFLLY